MLIDSGGRRWKTSLSSPRLRLNTGEMNAPPPTPPFMFSSRIEKEDDGPLHSGRRHAIVFFHRAQHREEERVIQL